MCVCGKYTVSIKDLKALQEQFASLTLTAADTKIVINDFASNTGFRPDSTLVRYYSLARAPRYLLPPPLQTLR